jgi:hypothetical protein
MWLFIKQNGHAPEGRQIFVVLLIMYLQEILFLVLKEFLLYVQLCSYTKHTMYIMILLYTIYRAKMAVVWVVVFCILLPPSSGQ